jgi:hypothetical protein
MMVEVSVTTHPALGMVMNPLRAVVLSETNHLVPLALVMHPYLVIVVDYLVETIYDDGIT